MSFQSPVLKIPETKLFPANLHRSMIDGLFLSIETLNVTLKSLSGERALPRKAVKRLASF